MAGKNKKQLEKKKKYPTSPLAGSLGVAWKDAPQGSTRGSVPTLDPAENRWRPFSPPPTSTSRQNPVGTASFRVGAHSGILNLP
jgi:hypothetical protein